ncbi:hypothetical protein E2C01_082254 [Portunus trituberculatus]|uniref:Uncharacterized protein n=1 Tax=Portunus trituberculatus TaxID=210409 RepID=A0A5B7IYQ3_PORTR|nr:hypothetical protein [Portunus trituberculatus]
MTTWDPLDSQSNHGPAHDDGSPARPLNRLTCFTRSPMTPTTPPHKEHHLESFRGAMNPLRCSNVDKKMTKRITTS